MIRFTYLSGNDKGKRLSVCPENIKRFPSLVETKNGKVFAENIQEPHHLYICGAGHVAKAVYDMATLLEIQTTVMDDRSEFVNENRFKNALRILTESYEDTIEAIDFKDSDSIAIMTRGHKDDYNCLKSVLQKDNRPGYIGMIGSKSKINYVYDKLRNDGIKDDLLKTVHSPIGLPFDTETPMEIALAILAEIYTSRHSKSLSIVERDTLLAMQNEKNGIEVIITEKQGSAPRNVGTRMVVTSDKVVGTIGGGAVENAAILEARDMLTTSDVVREKFYSLESHTAANLGMVCGGNVNVAFVRL